MTVSFRPALWLFMSLTIVAFPAMAQENLTESDHVSEEPASRYSDTTDHSWLSLGAGYYDIFDGDGGAWDFRAEYRHSEKLIWEIKPWGGAELTSDGSVWVGAGLLADFKMAPSIYVTPSVGVGLYAQGGADKDLGSPIEFRTGVEGGYEFMNGHRMGVAFSHMSNADIGDENPGAETLNVYYHVPVGDLF